MVEVRIPIPQGAVVDPKTGVISREWWRFLHALWQRSGGGGDITGLFTTDIGSTVQGHGADLDALDALAGTGLAARTAADTWAVRLLTAPVAGFTIANPGGVAGNPIFALANDLLALENLTGTGLSVRTAADTWTPRSIADGGGAFITNGNGVSGDPTIETSIQAFQVTVGQADVASAGQKILLNAAASEQWKVRDIILSGDGTNFSGGGGDRDLAITDGTTTWSVIPAATLQALAVSRWGVDAGMPNPATASHLFAASVSGTDIVAQYSGGATDYTAGSATIMLMAERVA